MQWQDTLDKRGIEAARRVSAEVAEQLQGFVSPLLARLDEQVDKRLVRTFITTLGAILRWRNRAHGLLLSELGGYILPIEQAAAGTKRLSNLLRSTKWTHQLIERFLWQKADERLEQLDDEQQTALLIWDESVIEKPESIAIEGLSAVRSQKARRLKRIKPGYYNPPGGTPVFVPGMHWLAVIVLGSSGPAVMAAMRWWTTRGVLSSDRRSQEQALLSECVQRWGRRLLHIFDRGFAGAPWLGHLFEQQARFIVRWPKQYHLQTLSGMTVKTWQLLRGKPSSSKRPIWDAPRRCYRTTGVVTVEVRHPDYPDERLWLVASRPGKGRAPWYLLTNEPIASDANAWRIVLAYGRRWQIEVAFRFAKSELAFESPRLWFWQNRLKLLLMCTLVFAFLLQLLRDRHTPLRDWLLRHFCPRTGQRSRSVSAPLYRLRSALSRLWSAHLPKFHFPLLTPG
jgi:hypothetical protein